MSNYLYLRVTPDKYELPEAVARTMKELASMCNTDEATICRSIKRYEQGNPSGRYRRVPDGKEWLG